MDYQFHEKYLSRGLAGGQDAADHFMEKVREHLASVASIMEPKAIPVMVKAFANLGGLAQACVRDKKVKSVGDVTQFWIGFVRRYALVDFVDVGSGKEEADNKIRGKYACMLHREIEILKLLRGSFVLYR